MIPNCTGLCVWYVSMVHVNGTCQWYVSMVRVNGTRQWYVSMVRVNGTRQWYASMVRVNGTRQWYASMVRVNGTRQWYVSMVWNCLLYNNITVSKDSCDTCDTNLMDVAQYGTVRYNMIQCVTVWILHVVQHSFD